MREEAGSRVTGGVVFLDELGDLMPVLQAKLLPVLSGGVFYRVGTEGVRNAELRYDGVTVVASWRPLEKLLRPDLFSRVSGYVIHVPGIADRLEDFPLIVDSIQASLTEGFKRRVEELSTADPGVDRAYWNSRLESVGRIGEDATRLLADVDWQRFGNLRGLTTAMERILLNREHPRHVVDTLAVVSEELDADGENVAPRAFVSRLLARSPDGRGLAKHLGEVELEIRRALRTLLTEDAASRAAVGRALGIEAGRLNTQIQQLDRTRASGCGRGRRS
jgi:transcriptional regulator with PAS, ATPase and Fis domain